MPVSPGLHSTNREQILPGLNPGLPLSQRENPFAEKFLKGLYTPKNLPSRKVKKEKNPNGVLTISTKIFTVNP